MERSIYIGYDPREAEAFSVCRGSLLRHLTGEIPVKGVVLAQLQCDGLYTRPIERHSGHLIDVLSRRPDYNGAMSTEFAISRFFVPMLAKTGWALFMDCDMLVRKDIADVFKLCDPTKAVMCVQHEYEPSSREKMDGQIQTPYYRKNWSSFAIFNCDHPANKRLTPELLNSAVGKSLHAFSWLKDDEIGALPHEWNFLVGHTDEAIDPAIVHYTEGLPNMRGYEDSQYANEWREARA